MSALTKFHTFACPALAGLLTIRSVEVTMVISAYDRNTVDIRLRGFVDDAPRLFGMIRREEMPICEIDGIYHKVVFKATVPSDYGLGSQEITLDGAGFWVAQPEHPIMAYRRKKKAQREQGEQA